MKHFSKWYSCFGASDGKQALKEPLYFTEMKPVVLRFWISTVIWGE